MKDQFNVLVVDDDPEMREFFAQALAPLGFAIGTAESGPQGIAKIRERKFDLVLCDVVLGKMSGIEVLEAVKLANPETEVIMMTGQATIAAAVDSMKKGAYDFIQKPISADELVLLSKKALERRELQADLAVYEASQAVFRSTKLDDLLPVIVRLAVKILRVDDISIMLTRGQWLEVVATHGLGTDERKKAKIPLGERVAGKVAQGQSAVIINGPLEKDSRFTGVSSLRKINASIVYPLTINGETLGVLTANRVTQTQPFVPSDMRSAAIFSAQIAQAIYNAQLYEKLEKKVAEVEAAYRKLADTQNQLVQSQKLAAVGQLAAGVAHELNNPLTAVMGYAQLVLADSALSAQQREDIECIHVQSQRCRRIIQDLLQFSRRSESQKTKTKVPQLIAGVLKLVQRELSNLGISVVQEIEKDIPEIFVDAAQMQQVFLNLINNARDAVKGVKNAKLEIRAARSGEYVEIGFRDNGAGIPKEHLDKVFDPFFTTKPVGQGTGLGLSVSYGILQDHGGDIRAQSQERAGTMFTVRLPLDTKNNDI